VDAPRRPGAEVTADSPGRPGEARDDTGSHPARDIRVLIADDEALVRAGFKVLVDSAPGLSVVGEASDGVQAVRQVRALKPDVVLMDIRMPVMGGLEATKVSTSGDSRDFWPAGHLRKVGGRFRAGSGRGRRAGP
jgi:PleD family two-component response regulator